jgi:uncharacterized DUF497 family protein
MDERLPFEWDVDNVAHLARHGVLVEEAEEVLSGDLMDLDYRVTDEGEERGAAVGRTASGRVLVIVWILAQGGRYRPITAYPATKQLERVYLRLLEGV